MALLDMRVDEEREVVPTRLLLVRPTVLDDGEVKALLEFSVHAITRAMNHMQTVGVSGDLLNRFIFVDCISRPVALLFQGRRAWQGQREEVGQVEVEILAFSELFNPRGTCL